MTFERTFIFQSAVLHYYTPVNPTAILIYQSHARSHEQHARPKTSIIIIMLRITAPTQKKKAAWLLVLIRIEQPLSQAHGKHKEINIFNWT